MLKTGFPLVIGEGPKVLILGSMPGELSLQEQQYYAHPRNAFWYILGELLSIPEDTSYSEKLAILKECGIALWDVLYACERQGSLDASINNATIQPNDFTNLLLFNSSIDLIIFNGAKAEHEFKKRVFPKLSQQLQQTHQVRLPSTSPAMASIKKEEKLEAWKETICPYLAPLSLSPNK